MIKYSKENLEFRIHKVYDTDNDFQFHLIYLKKFEKIDPLAIQNYILSLFQTPSEVKLVENETVQLQQIPKLKNLSSCFIQKEEVEAKDFENFIKSHPSLKGVAVDGQINGELDDDVDISGIRNLMFLKARKATANILKNFKKSVLNLKEAQCDNSLLIDVVRKWYNKEAYDQLKLITVILKPEYQFDTVDRQRSIEHVREFEPKRSDPKRRPKEYWYQQEYIPLKVGEPMTAGNQLDIEQKSGGKLMSIICEFERFQFFVWLLEYCGFGRAKLKYIVI
ncbi:hypothetical protein L3Y34_002026 [Caenorhabditis briggsae]|uniref:Uncharacterized protein n=1 Tax=Caenorhabditis briggsae TaxID=6238 RepID=A0AAE9IRL7_CAEBR|nr:hypothetical protein L3Y34_002026 [Caenorhabditis briggsae]